MADSFESDVDAGGFVDEEGEPSAGGGDAGSEEGEMLPDGSEPFA